MAEPVVADCAASNADAELERIAELLGGLDIVLLAYGVLGDQARLERDPAAAAGSCRRISSAPPMVPRRCNRFERQRSGSLVVIGSVAGDRGRASNYVYGASKAGLGVLVEGIAHRLAKSGARAILIKPGFVDTPMTAHVPRKGLPLGGARRLSLRPSSRPRTAGGRSCTRLSSGKESWRSYALFLRRSFTRRNYRRVGQHDFVSHPQLELFAEGDELIVGKVQHHGPDDADHMGHKLSARQSKSGR